MLKCRPWKVWNGRTLWTSTTKTKTFYEILSIPPTASRQQVKAAFYEASKHSHPDRVRDSSQKAAALSAFLSIKEAYETLSDPVKRVSYDLSLGLTPKNGSQGTTDFSAWTSSSGIPPEWTAYQASTDSTSNNPFAFRRSSAPFVDPTDELVMEDHKTLILVAFTGALACLAGFWGMVAYYNYAVEDAPSAMKEAENYHRARAIVLEYAPVDWKEENYRQKHNKESGYYGAPPPGGSRNGMYARRVSPSQTSSPSEFHPEAKSS